MMFGFALSFASHAHYLLRRFLPTNVLLDAIHSRRGLKWGVPAMLLAIPYGLAAVYCSGAVQAGGSGWLSAFALLFVWNALRLVVAGPVAATQLIHVRACEARARRRPCVGTARGRAAVGDFAMPVRSPARGDVAIR
ncbi:sulfate permease [Leifsonia sp. Root4]|uniref:sulfate permease n=1 Tax=Leifsonia sp. Root4 TaxID=1736525 RepID=UPI000AADAD32|nr:sulfate permease [Leifsonia sp. Root4]